jgi:hypothetical protein
MFRESDPFDKKTSCYDDDDRDKPSWRDLDRKRDRSNHRPGEGAHAPKSRRDVQEAFHKKQLENLFKPGANLTSDQKKLLKKIRDAKGDEAINKACQAYLKKFDMPRDWENLTLFLDSTEPTITLPALDGMGKIFPSQAKSAQDNFKQQLKLIKMMATNRDIRTKAEQLFKDFA